MVCGRCGIELRILLADPILDALAEGLATRRGAGRAAGRARCGKLEPVHLADNGIAGHPFAQLACNLACTQPFHPELLQGLDALVRPACRLCS